MINIRQSTFETNSSSTHSICVCKEDETIKIPEKIKIILKDYNYEFGWEYTKWDTPEEKLAYLILGIIARSYYYTSYMGACAQIDKLLNMLKELGVKDITISGLEISLYDSKICLSNENSYVDHASELGELIENILTNKEYLKNYLFSYKSFILGGNDNENGYPNINVDYPHIELFKGN